MNNAEKYFNRGWLLSMKGLHQEAIDAYKKALGIDPGHSQARTNLKFISYFSGIGLGEDRVKNVANLKNIEKGAKKLLQKL
ncbi:MAG: tetratricopeptide repeat protein [Syntrophales bacterium]|nr:tetratricopeptide repeat protein [Syntrophales bacterium]